MPLVSVLGEQSLNAVVGIDQPGNGIWFINDSDSDIFGLVEEYRSAEFRVSAFFIRDDIGAVTARYELGEGVAFNFAAYDQNAFLIYPANGDFETYPPIVFYADNPPYPFEGEVADYPPSYVFTNGSLFAVDGDELHPVGRPTQAAFANGIARVYQAPDGDGSGIFLEVIDGEGHRVGGVVRVNDDILGDQSAPIVLGLDEAFSVGWTQESYDGSNAELYRAKTFNLTSNLDMAVVRDPGTSAFVGDVGDYVTDIFVFDTAATPFGAERIVGFGRNDIFVTTTELYDSNGDGIIKFGSDRRLDIDDDNGLPAASIAFAGLTALEFDGTLQADDGQEYFVYSRVGSAADQHYLIL